MTNPPGDPTAGPALGSLDHANALSFLGTCRTLTKVWVLLGALVGLLNVVGIIYSVFTLRFAGSAVGGLLYAAIWIMVDVMILGRIGAWTADVSRGEYQAVKEPLLLWGVLGLLFGVVPGVLLLIAYLRLLPWSNPLGTGRVSAPPPAAGPPIPPSTGGPTEATPGSPSSP